MLTYNMEMQSHSDLKNKSNLFQKRKNNKIFPFAFLGSHLSTSVHFHLREDFLPLLSSSSNNLFSRSRAERLI